ncbi:hypothetical protein JOB18_035739 [Solea senegalensis]|uniref:Uncharacterized protein n=1 Tax=Solea senegalensis TaxID=28829 RepID=A0AAV6Q4Y9_SOLSE|nr:hypothetical protein JOB18_035739 [Solea senegalensis]
MIPARTLRGTPVASPTIHSTTAGENPCTLATCPPRGEVFYFIKCHSTFLSSNLLEKYLLHKSFTFHKDSCIPPWTDASSVSRVSPVTCRRRHHQSANEETMKPQPDLISCEQPDTLGHAGQDRTGQDSHSGLLDLDVDSRWIRAQRESTNTNTPNTTSPPLFNVHDFCL